MKKMGGWGEKIFFTLNFPKPGLGTLVNFDGSLNIDFRISASEICPPEYEDPSSPYHFSRLLLHQFNFFSWENR